MNEMEGRFYSQCPHSHSRISISEWKRSSPYCIVPAKQRKRQGEEERFIWTEAGRFSVKEGSRLINDRVLFSGHCEGLYRHKVFFWVYWLIGKDSLSSILFHCYSIWSLIKNWLGTILQNLFGMKQCSPITLAAIPDALSSSLPNPVMYCNNQCR